MGQIGKLNPTFKVIVYNIYAVLFVSKTNFVYLIYFIILFYDFFSVLYKKIFMEWKTAERYNIKIIIFVKCHRKMQHKRVIQSFV